FVTGHAVVNFTAQFNIGGVEVVKTKQVSLDIMKKEGEHFLSTLAQMIKDSLDAKKLKDHIVAKVVTHPDICTPLEQASTVLLKGKKVTLPFCVNGTAITPDTAVKTHTKKPSRPPSHITHKSTQAELDEFIWGEPQQYK